MTAAKKVQQQEAGAELVKFNFHGDMLDVAEVDGEHFVVLARLCEPFALRADGQAEKLRMLPWARTQKIWVRDSRGQMQEVVCLSIRSVAGWLFTLNRGKVAAHLRDKLDLYQRECADVLADHFLGKRKQANDAEQDMLVFLVSTVRKLEERVAAMALEAGTISGLQADWITGEIDVLAGLRVSLGYHPSMRSAKTWIQARVAAASAWSGTGARRRDMPAASYPRVKVCLAQLRCDLEAEARRRHPGKRSVAIIKSALQGHLPFDKAN